MIPTRYYTQLGLPQNANELEVKKAYRSLVKRYHHDVNPSKEAHSKFLKITEAYEIITGQRPLPKSRSRKQTPQQNSNPQNNSDPQELAKKEQRERWKQRKEQFEKIEYLKQLKKHQLHQSGWRHALFNVVFYASLACLILMTLDYNLPLNVTKHRLNYSRYMGVSKVHAKPYYQINYDQNQMIEVTGGIGGSIAPDEVFFITHTFLMNEKRDLVLRGGSAYERANIMGSVFSILPIAYILLLFPLIAKYLRNNIWAYTSSYYFALYITGLFLLYLFLEELRILRMLHLIQ